MSKSSPKASTGYAHNLNFGKKGGRWNFQLVEDVADPNYNINDMGILFTSNYIEHYLWTGYRWIEPKNWYKRVQINFNAGYSTLFKNFANQKINTRFQSFNANINANAQLKSLWWVGDFIGYTF